MLDKPFKIDECRRCKAAVWYGQVCGFKVALDCGPLTLPAEILCRLQIPVRRTFVIWRTNGQMFADLRTVRNIKAGAELVLAKHECGSEQALAVHPDYWPKPVAQEVGLW
ncbi:hypothetical protein UFOVP1616_30 [uncultured Caudovirales phage]|uniref:Uncharacterized protein n=1 Tax=uncultured Caudovirales phage TaxID=2100421 RepID=A0A6J5SJW0_9CAUD|nr:hypothetical protein UFOVP1467_46 [uncultured Caudovirales phage]CAB4219649.1 hypothetical protein UFOVP1616_30 [uncultured Caudovirales phage]